MLAVYLKQAALSQKTDHFDNEIRFLRSALDIKNNDLE